MRDTSDSSPPDVIGVSKPRMTFTAGSAGAIPCCFFFFLRFVFGFSGSMKAAGRCALFTTMPSGFSTCLSGEDILAARGGIRQSTPSPLSRSIAGIPDYSFFEVSRGTAQNQRLSAFCVEEYSDCCIPIQRSFWSLPQTELQ